MIDVLGVSGFHRTKYDFRLKLSNNSFSMQLIRVLTLQNKQMATSPTATSPVNQNVRPHLRVVIPSTRPTDIPVSEDQVSQSESLPQIGVPKYSKRILLNLHPV